MEGTKRRALIVCASRAATGNSLKLAEAIRDALGGSCEIFEPASAPDPANFDFIAFCFGVYHGWPEEPMKAYMKRCRGKDVGVAMTLGAYADSEHAFVCMGRAEGLLDSCRVKAKFVCQGRIDPALVERMKAKPPGAPHSWNPERAKRVETAERHPDQADLAKAAWLFKEAWSKLLAGEASSPRR